MCLKPLICIQNIDETNLICGQPYSCMENFPCMLTGMHTGKLKQICLTYSVSFPVLPVGNAELNLIPVAQVGECVHQIFEQRDKYLGSIVGLASDRLTLEQISQIMCKHLEENIVKGEVRNTLPYYISIVALTDLKISLA